MGYSERISELKQIIAGGDRSKTRAEAKENVNSLATIVKLAILSPEFRESINDSANIINQLLKTRSDKNEEKQKSKTGELETKTSRDTSITIAGNRFLMNEQYQVKDSTTEFIILLAAAILSFFGFFGTIIGCWVNGVLNGQQEEHLAKNEGQSTLRPYTSWGKAENKCWELWKCEPCCGEPCNLMDGLKCFACWVLPCFSLCTLSKFYASSVKDEECTILGHFVPYLVALACSMFVPIPVFNSAPCLLLRIATRHNFRQIDGTGDARYMFGDALLGLFCSPCAMCQELRSAPVESWDWYAQYQEKSFPTGELSYKFFLEER